jgi:hypothetical protein
MVERVDRDVMEFSLKLARVGPAILQSHPHVHAWPLELDHALHIKRNG